MKSIVNDLDTCSLLHYNKDIGYIQNTSCTCY